MEGCRDRLLASLDKHDQSSARRLSAVLDALLHLDGEVRRHAEPRFLVEATLARLAVELGTGAAAPEASAPSEVVGKPSPAPEPLRVPTPPPPAPLPARGEVNAPSPAGAETKIAAPVSGWAEVLEQLNRTVRAVYLDAQPEVEGSTLILWFRYGFHHKKAQEQSPQLVPLVRAWLGDATKIEYRLRESEGTKPAARPASPEDDPFVREVVRRFDGRVTRVKEVSE
jgi:hypothetical protein